MSQLGLSHATPNRLASFLGRPTLPVGLALLLWLPLSGCGQQDASSEQQDASSEPAAEDSAAAHDAADGDHDAAHSGHDEADSVQASLAKLSAEDRELAEEQGICPVTEKPLGWMGTPVKITVEGRDVLLCCAGCEDAVRGAPDEHFEKLDRD